MISQKTNILTTCLAILLAAFFFTVVQESYAMSTAPGVYNFFGRVLNQEGKPVSGCTVLLVKRMVQKPVQQDANGQVQEKQYEIISEELVATTAADGDYEFIFEPLTADNFWVFFNAEGYQTRSVELDGLMRSRFFTKPNKTPIKLDVVLEKN